MKVAVVLVLLMVAGATAHYENYMTGYDAVLRQHVRVPTDLLIDEGDHRSKRANAPSLKIPDHWPRLYVGRGGVITNTTDNEFAHVLVSATPLTRPESLERAAKMVAIQTGHMDNDVWSNLVHGGVVLGVYAHEEKLTEYPTFKHMASRDCDHSCDGRCRGTCASLGRKFEDLVGLGGSGIAVVKEDNVVCNDFDPYRKGESILMHEFGHTIKTGFTHALGVKWAAAYNAAKAGHIWNTGAYGMSNTQEFWAEATQVWFGVTMDNRSYAAGMNLCHGAGPVCKDAKEGQEFLKVKQRAIYDVLLQVYNSGDPTIDHGADLCPAGNGVDWSYH